MAHVKLYEGGFFLLPDKKALTTHFAREKATSDCAVGAVSESVRLAFLDLCIDRPFFRQSNCKVGTDQFFYFLSM
ncbi:hypothetical protein GPALN_014944 [Globodera pallida]|nr:hypothetical protein GPALN_014944 [Globodera pallida]